MKSAEQWSLEFGYNGQAALVEFVKRIQRDAWRQGMTDAAKIEPDNQFAHAFDSDAEIHAFLNGFNDLSSKIEIHRDRAP